jgi:FkbM family methyltransferase
MTNRITRSILFRYRAWSERRREARELREALAGATPILKDDHGVRFVLYPWNRPQALQFIHRSFDTADFRAISQLVRAGDIAFDVGANVGEYSVLLGRQCGAAGQVWAFEPVPDTYWRLRETLALNRCGNVTPVQAAVSDKSGTVRMNLFEPQYSAWNTLGMPEMVTPEGERVSPAKSVDVASRTLDEFCRFEKIERINFLKVDVEGFEEAVFRGAAELLRGRRIDCVCFEISQAPLKGANATSRSIFEALEAFGYSAYSFNEAEGSFHGPIQDTAEYWANFYASWMDLSKIGSGKKLESIAVNQTASALE